MDNSRAFEHSQADCRRFLRRPTEVSFSLRLYDPAVNSGTDNWRTLIVHVDQFRCTERDVYAPLNMRNCPVRVFTDVSPVTL